jgi:hypothetical protein
MQALSRYLPILFFVSLILWTIGLLVPIPERSAEVLGGEWNEFIFAKSLHAGAYAYLTILTALMNVSRRQHWLLLGLMSIHGFLTELLQWSIPLIHRHGCWRDVGIDHIGILLGLFLTWRRWRELMYPATKAQ